MKTVQEHLRTVNKDELIDTYLYRYPIRLHEINDKTRTVAEVIAHSRDVLSRFIDRLCSLKAEDETAGSRWILYAVRSLDAEVDDIDFLLIKEDEFLEKGDAAESYAYEFETHETMLGYCVSDAPLTLHNLTDLLASFLYEASFFGFEQESLAEVKETLEEAASAIDSGEYKGKCVSIEELFGKYGTDLDVESPDERELHGKALVASGEYMKYSRSKELEKLKAILSKGD